MGTPHAQKMNALRAWTADQTNTLMVDLLRACGVWDTMPEVLTELMRTRGFELGALRPETEGLEYCVLVSIMQFDTSFALLDAAFATAAAVVMAQEEAPRGARRDDDVLDVGRYIFRTEKSMYETTLVTVMVEVAKICPGRDWAPILTHLVERLGFPIYMASDMYIDPDTGMGNSFIAYTANKGLYTLYEALLPYEEPTLPLTSSLEWMRVLREGVVRGGREMLWTHVCRFPGEEDTERVRVLRRICERLGTLEELQGCAARVRALTDAHRGAVSLGPKYNDDDESSDEDEADRQQRLEWRAAQARLWMEHVFEPALRVRRAEYSAMVARGGAPRSGGPGQRSVLGSRDLRGRILGLALHP